jgi:hypothetical protein
LEIVQLGNLLFRTIHDEDDVIEYTTDPELIFEKWQNPVDMVYDVTDDNGFCTIIDLSDEPEVIRKERKLGYSLDYNR